MYHKYMSSESDYTEENSTSGDSVQHGAEPRILLFMQSGRDRDLLVETLGERYQVETTTDVETLKTKFDCCVFDVHEFNRVAGTVQSRRDPSNSIFLPFVLLVSEESADTVEEAWEYVDDIVELPVKKKTLHSRIGNLVERRRTAAKLAEREEELKETVKDLKLKERAMDEAPLGITITNVDEVDNPLIYVNEMFKDLTGYSSNVLGEDCRFLQGEETDSKTVAAIREAIEAREPVSVDILNYRKNNQKFWNSLDIAPIPDEDGNVTNFVWFQTDITERKIRERRLEVLNRVLRHNLRNKMNVIQGYTMLLRRTYDDTEPPDALTEIEEAAADVSGLADTVQKVERILNTPESEDTHVELDERLKEMMSMFRDRYSSARFELTLPERGSCEVSVVGLTTAIKEAIDNAIKHNDSSEPLVEVTVERLSDGWIDIEIKDNGPGIPSREIDVLEKGETPLKHADRLSIWLIYWVVKKAGGDFSVSEADQGGTVVDLSVPTSG